MKLFTDQQLERYSRHIILQQVGIEGQQKIMDGKVLIIGVGGLGSPAAFYLSAAGVGTIGLVDADSVELSNLQRQIIHFTRDLQKPKVESAREKMEALNPDVKIKTYSLRVDAAHILDIIKEYDFVIDGTDNFPTKFLINDACVLEGIPFSHGGILRFAGQTITVLPGKSACYRCVFPEPPPVNAVPSCSQAGILGVIAGILGTIQATEALKYLLGKGELLTDTLLTFDALKMDFRKVRVQKRSSCLVCGEQPTILQPENIEQPVCDLRR